MKIDIEKVVNKLCGDAKVNRDYAEKYARSVVENLDERLLPNLQEWLEDKPISEIWIGKYCVGAVMSIQGNADFFRALEIMNVYLHDEQLGVNLIWEGRK